MEPTAYSPEFDEQYESTHESRITIGFSPRDSWRTAPAVFDSHSMSILGHPVMEDWEYEYMHELAAVAAGYGGVVLEVGFGMGISARAIQEHKNVIQHIVVEANESLFSHVLDFKRTSSQPVVPLLGFWEDITPLIESESIDGILFDTYPLSEDEIHKNHFKFFEEAHRLLRPGGLFTYYSDEAEDFSDEHIRRLHAAGFTDIQRTMCNVQPPPDCAYWKKNSLLVPIIRK